jgi:transposase
MCSHVNSQDILFSYVSSESRVPASHPLRRIKAVADQVLRGLSTTFAEMYNTVGHLSIPPERLLNRNVLITRYSMRSRRLFSERLDTDLLIRWFLDINLDQPSFEHSTFRQNSERLLAHVVTRSFSTRS